MSPRIIANAPSFLMCLVLATACAAQPPASEPATQRSSAAPPPAAVKDCAAFEADAQSLLDSHNMCTQDEDCAFVRVEGRGCIARFGCGGGYVRNADAETFLHAASALEARYAAQCTPCASELAAACGPPRPACVQGRCAAMPVAAPSCEEREARARDLIQQHNRCSSDADCTLVLSDGGCPPSLACATPVEKLSAQGFAADAAEHSREYAAQCNECARPVTTCRQRETVCRAGRCVLEEK